MQRSLSLQGRLAMLVVAAILPLAALSVWFAVSATREATRDAQSQLKFSASLVAAHQDRMVESAQQLLAAVVTMPGLRGTDVQRCAAYFDGLRTLYPVYSNIGILDLEGRTVCHANQRSGSFAAGDRDYVQRALSERRLVMGQVVTGRSSGRSAIPFAQPIMEGDAVVALAFASLDLNRAADALARLDLPEGASVVVSDRHGQVLMEHPRKGAKAVPAGLVPTALEGGSGEFRDASGQAQIFGSAASRQISGEGFVAVVAMDRAQITRVSSAKLRNEILVLAITLLFGVAAAWWIGGRAIVKPAKQILGAVRRLEQGLLDARVPLQAGPPRGEFARIGAAFNLMAESLQLRQIDLETELGRSRSAYAALDLVLNSMQDGLLAVTAEGQFLMFNEAAARLLPLATPAPRQQWAQHFGFYQADGVTPYRSEDLPLVRSTQGESGRQQLFVRNALVPQGRLLQCSWQPIRGEGGLNGGLVVFTDVTELQRLQAEQAAQFAQLRETQRKLIEAQRIGRVGNWELDLRSGRIWWSDEVYGLFGITREQFEPTLNGFAQWVHPDDRGLLKPARDAALRDGKVVNMEYRVVKPDGTLAWMNEIAEARRNEQGEPIWFGGVVQEITARKKNEQALLHSESELQDYTSMLQRAAEAAQAITAHPALEETLQEVADQARRVIGTRQALVSLTGSTGADPAMRRTSGEQDEAITSGRLIVPLASRSGQNIGQLELSGKERGDFTQRDEYVALELAQLASIAIDNARLFTQIRELNAGLEARIAERTSELTRQEQLYRTLAEQAPEVVWNTDATGKLTFLNRAWYELVGGTPADWIGTSGMAAIHPDDRAAVAANWLRCCETLSTFTGVRRVRAKGGGYHTMSYKAAPVLVEGGKVAFWVGIDADITEFKAIERALRSSNQELEAFSYSVSHDLRAPLGAIGGFGRALALKLEGHPDDRALHYLARVQAGVEKMEQLIESLLSLAKVVRAPLNYGEVDLSAMAREIVEGLQMQHPERRISVQVKEGMLAQGDARLLRVVLENLLGNAWKFTSRAQAALVEVGKLEGSSVFFVRDNGVGFDMAYASKLFGAFQRLHTEAEFPGTGIGLATVRRIVARHQGRVWAESQLGLGTSFFFVLSESAPPAWLVGDGQA